MERACECPTRDGMVYHQRPTCTDPITRRLDWFAEPVASEPTAIWSGELTISGVTLHVHVLDDGMRVIEHADVHALLLAWEQGATLTDDEAAAFGRWLQSGDDPQ